MIFAAVLFVFYMCDLHSKISFINWPWTVRKGPALQRVARGLGSWNGLKAAGC